MIRLGWLVLALASAVVAPVAAAAPADACRALADAAHARDFASILDAPTAVLSATVIPAGGDGSPIEADLPEHCRVEGQIPPAVGFLLRLPTQAWNGKFMMGGCGGPCGVYMTDRIDPALVRGYATVVTDMGHKGAGFGFMRDNLAGQIDFAYRATHVTAVAAKTIVAAFYGRAAARNYYAGCSTGGRQGMVEAQRFPGDFEGIVAGAPVWNQTLNNPMFGSWGAIANTGNDGRPILDARKLPLIHRAVLAACDARDGLADGILQDPRRCAWDPAALLCKAGAGEDCLTAAEADVVRKIYDGPRNAVGAPLFWGMMRGSEDQWGPWVGHDGTPGSAIADGYTNAAISYAAFPGPAPYFVPRDFDYVRDPPRLGLTEWMFNAQNPDLRRFKAAGGKLILYTGWNDNNIPPGAVVDYYETAERTLGGPAATRDFFRLFLLPAVNHCGTGLGGGEVDWIGALEAWVERGKAPEAVIAHHMLREPYPVQARALTDPGFPLTLMPRHPLSPGSFDRARPVYPYPDVAQYRGRGDPALPASWRPAPR
jgi:feruloyl esterase